MPRERLFDHPMLSLKLLLILVVIVDQVLNARLKAFGIESKHGFLLLILLLFHLLLYILLYVIDYLQLGVLADDKRLRSLDLRWHLDLVQKCCLDVRAHLVNELVEFVLVTWTLLVFIIVKVSSEGAATLFVYGAKVVLSISFLLFLLATLLSS